MTIHIPDGLKWVFEMAGGGQWPEGDEDAVREVAKGHEAYAKALEEDLQKFNDAMSLAKDSVEGKIHDALADLEQKVADQLKQVADAHHNQAKALKDAANTIEYTKGMMIAALVTLAAEIATAIAMMPFTCGASAAAEAAAIAAAKVLFNTLSREMILKLMRAATIAAVVGIEDVALKTVSSVVTQKVQVDKGTRDKIDGDLVRDAAKTSGIGAAAGLLGAPLGAVAGGAVEKGLQAAGGAAAKAAGVEVGETTAGKLGEFASKQLGGAADAVTGSAVTGGITSAATGQKFDPATLAGAAAGKAAGSVVGKGVEKGSAAATKSIPESSGLKSAIEPATDLGKSMASEVAKTAAEQGAIAGINHTPFDTDKLAGAPVKGGLESAKGGFGKAEKLQAEASKEKPVAGPQPQGTVPPGTQGPQPEGALPHTARTPTENLQGPKEKPVAGPQPQGTVPPGTQGPQPEGALPHTTRTPTENLQSSVPHADSSSAGSAHAQPPAPHSGSGGAQQAGQQASPPGQGISNTPAGHMGADLRGFGSGAPAAGTPLAATSPQGESPSVEPASGAVSPQAGSVGAPPQRAASAPPILERQFDQNVRPVQTAEPVVGDLTPGERDERDHVLAMYEAQSAAADDDVWEAGRDMGSDAMDRSASAR
ncbi:hypothetical protein Srot_0492 [Segniliparus rotundus DSM 44985]|uniref:Outer membrane channel protein CpnT-like N-terminal domain-containing protein n=1 Tax=Segniliparus rotundus (strain ATCC BAA-972 / CDC 1076 / CIP 108378 / DSM 44985 / JCM 13578) TaxID=640132 RepID=D6ZC02_SEGRD|nr:hypothetical protein [Segniliparus rotundus]ADG96979.1 hypothetical protein Srot_0492 [Segniliparus rotundus DSM 44985]